MRLSVCSRPMLDELWQGYIMRLSVMNDVRSLEVFEQNHIYGGTRKRRNGQRYPESLTHVCERLSQDRIFPGIEQAIAMTPFYAEADRLPEGKQAKLAESILYDINDPLTPNYRLRQDFRFTTCPECRKEDIAEHGFWYLHLSHHLPGVKACRKHGIPLMEMNVFDKRHACYPETEKGKMEIANLAAAIAHAEAMEQAYQKNKGILLKKFCPDCRKTYLIHPYSDRTGAGCPFCRRKLSPSAVVEQRLRLITGEGYHVVGEFKNMNMVQIRHDACGCVKRNLEYLLYEGSKYCDGCRKMTVSKMQERIDPTKKDFIVLNLFRNKSGNRSMRVTHQKCGRTFDIITQDFQNKPHCIWCDRKQKIIDVGEVHGDYEIISPYTNNRNQVTFRHLDCGCTFPMSKNSFLAGGRCPVCTNRYDFLMAEKVLEECAEDYSVTKGKKRGTVDLFCFGEKIADKIPYSKIMNDLQAEEPKLILRRKKKYQPPKSIRRMIFDSVKKGVEEKGFWEGKDGIDGHPMTRGERNILQDLANHGFVKRTEKGKYII